MQSRSRLLILLTIVTIFLAVIFVNPFFVNPFSEEATSSPFALAIEEAFTGRVTIDSHLLITTDAGFDHTRFGELVDLLNEIDTGKSTLSLINQYDIGIQFTSERGSRFNPNTNQIFINRSHKPVLAALILIHEVTHAFFLHESSAVDVLNNSRETYIAKKVQEEAVAVVNSIEAKMELEAAGVDTTGQQTTLEMPYRQAYEMAKTAASVNDDTLDEDSAQTIGRAAARKKIFEALMTGKAVTSNTQQTYPSYWGADWDRHNDVS
jgi:hypothetical protein